MNEAARLIIMIRSKSSSIKPNSKNSALIGIKIERREERIVVDLAFAAAEAEADDAANLHRVRLIIKSSSLSLSSHSPK